MWWSAWAKKILVEYNYSSLGEPLAYHQIRCGSVKWFPPCPGFYKINCDTAIDSNKARVGIGIVIRDSIGFIMASSSQVIAAAFNAQVAEAMAIRRAIMFSNDCCLFPCVLESDVEVFVNWIKKGSHLDSAGGVILSDISSLSIEGNGLSISFVPHQANQVTLFFLFARNALRSI